MGNRFVSWLIYLLCASLLTAGFREAYSKDVKNPVVENIKERIKEVNEVKAVKNNHKATLKTKFRKNKGELVVRGGKNGLPKILFKKAKHPDFASTLSFYDENGDETKAYSGKRSGLKITQNGDYLLFKREHAEDNILLDRDGNPVTDFDIKTLKGNNFWLTKDGAFISTTTIEDDGSIIKKGQPRKTLRVGFMITESISRNGDFMVFGGGNDLLGGNGLFLLNSSGNIVWSQGVKGTDVYHVAISDDAKYVAAVVNDFDSGLSRLIIKDIHGGDLSEMPLPLGGNYDSAFSNDGNALLLWTGGNNIYLYNAELGALIWERSTPDAENGDSYAFEAGAIATNNRSVAVLGRRGHIGVPNDIWLSIYDWEGRVVLSELVGMCEVADFCRGTYSITYDDALKAYALDLPDSYLIYTVEDNL